MIASRLRETTINHPEQKDNLVHTLKRTWYPNARILTLILYISKYLEKKMATYSSTVAWRIPWKRRLVDSVEEESMGSQESQTGLSNWTIQASSFQPMLHSKDCAELCLKVKEIEVSQSCPTLCDPVDYSPPGSSIHGIFQARMLKWVAMPSCRGCSQPRDQTWVSCIEGRLFTVWTMSNIP